MPSNSFQPDDLSTDSIAAFRNRLLEWGKTHSRSFFWRERKLEPYEILVVEVLLARTRAESVEPIARQFLDRYSTPGALQKAKTETVEDLLRPLGLFRKRGSALLDCAERLVVEFEGEVPEDAQELQKLPYVGRYAANAILCFGFGRDRPVVDSNVARVFQRYFDLREPESKLGNDELYWETATRLVPEKNARLYNWSLLDLGAVVCTPRNPTCERCPIVAGCVFSQSQQD